MANGVETGIDEREAEPKWHGPFALRAFRHRNFALLWTGQLISLTGTWMQSLSLPYLTFTLTGSKFLLGIVAAATAAPSLIATLPSGVLADRFSKRKITIGTQIVLMIQALLLFALTYAHVIQVWHIIALAMLGGFANSMDMPTRQSMVVELVGKDDLQNAVALNSSMFNLTRIAGPFMGGIVLAVVGPAWCFLINAVSYLGAIAGLAMMRNVKSAKQASRRDSMMGQIGEGIAHVWHNPLMRDMLLMTAIATVFIGPYGIFFPVYALKIFHVGAKGQGMMSAAVGVGALAAAALVSSLGHKYETKKIVFAGAILAPAGLTAFALSGSFYLCLIFLMSVGIGMMMFMASSNTIMQVEAPPALTGRVMSVRALVLFGFGAIGSTLMGFLSELKHVGVHGTILIGASVGLATSLYFAISSRKSNQGSK